VFRTEQTAGIRYGMLRRRSSTMAKTSTRNDDLRQALNTRRRQVQDEVQGRIREGRTSDRSTGVRDIVDISDAILQEEIDMALLQMRAETLTRIDEALVRLDGGQYGCCFECGDQIAAERLRALPFAVRCRDCEQKREDQGRARQSAARRNLLPFAGGAGS
jgi:DnaK suppressor protein